MYKINKLKKFLGDKLQEHVVLRNYTSVHIGGVADYFCKIDKIEDLIGTIIAAREDGVPFFVLGGGSNVIISDYGYPGLIIKNQTNNISFVNDKAQVIADSGTNLSRLVLESINHGLGGLDALYGIYGTLGGAIYGNAGAYGKDIFEFIKTVTMLSPNNKLISKDATWFEPEYRSTKLKKNQGNDYIILTAKLQLAHSRKEQLLEQIVRIKKERDQKFGGLGYSCGSIFKNPNAGNTYNNAELAKKNSAGFLLEQSGAKKIKVGDAGVFSKHANIYENKGNATALETKKLFDTLKDKVREEFGVQLEEEVEYVGQWE